jgi:CheY-like chemotaxis protein/HPt (histidine-containing phosphotransfer) domain-containing protein
MFTARFALTKPPAQPSPPLPRAEAMRVLVVDDQADASLALADLLGALGVGTAPPGGVDRAGDGELALAMVERADRAGHPYDLILVDWVMPRMDGAAVLRALKARVPAGPLPGVVSAYDSEMMHRIAGGLGVRHFVPKPVLPQSLRTLVRWLGGDESPATDGERQASASVDLAGLRVLLVEDNAMNRQLAVELLRDKQVEVHVAHNGQEAIERINDHGGGYYAVVLMDLQMPVMDGYEATRLLRLDPRFVDLPIVALSAHAMADERERCQVLGMNGHLSKPIEPDALYAALAAFRAAPAAERPGPTTVSPYAAGLAPPLDASRLPAVAGLDVAAGLHHADGKLELYVQLLRRFAIEYAAFAETFAALLDAADWPEGILQAHTLKGLAASLGARELRAAATTLERAARQRGPDAARAALRDVDAQLRPLLQGLREQLPAPTPLRAKFPAPAPADTATWLPRLRELLAQGDVEALELWEARQVELAELLPDQTLQRVSRALERFEFDVAAEALSGAGIPGAQPA